MGKGICEAVDALFYILFPEKNFCLNCGRLQEEKFGLCPYCYTEILKCKLYTRILNTYPIKVAFDEVYSVFKYEKVAKDIVRRLKYKEKLELSKVMALFMKETIEENKIKFDLIVPIPISKKRLKLRGYNQALLIAKELSKLTFIPFNDCIEKIKDTKSQTLFKDENRWYNVKGVFDCKENLQGKTILLVDDVFTTGATAHYASEALKKSKAKKVIVLTFAS
ncbi:MAG: ComF family protein [Caloramator sp.]|nr:ComF family protein [Caloramator sp.]